MTPLSDKAITSFLKENAESMQKVLIQEIRDQFVEKKGDKIVWKQGFRVRLQEIEEVEARHKEAAAEALKKLEEGIDSRIDDWERVAGDKPYAWIFIDLLGELRDVLYNNVFKKYFGEFK